MIANPIEGVDGGIEVPHQRSYVIDFTFKNAAFTVPSQMSLLNDLALYGSNPMGLENGLAPKRIRPHNKSRKLTYYAISE